MPRPVVCEPLLRCKRGLPDVHRCLPAPIGACKATHARRMRPDRARPRRRCTSRDDAHWSTRGAASASPPGGASSSALRPPLTLGLAGSAGHPDAIRFDFLVDAAGSPQRAVHEVPPEPALVPPCLCTACHPSSLSLVSWPWPRSLRSRRCDFLGPRCWARQAASRGPDRGKRRLPVGERRKEFYETLTTDGAGESSVPVSLDKRTPATGGSPPAVASASRNASAGAAAVGPG